MQPVKVRHISSAIFCIFIFSFRALSQSDLKNGLVAQYSFSGNYNDESGNTLHGRPNNAILTTDRMGNSNSACYLNGKNAYVELPLSDLYNFGRDDQFTLSAWIAPDAGNSWPAQALLVKSPFDFDFTVSQWTYGLYLLNYKGMSGYAYRAILNSKTTINSKTCWYNLTVTYQKGKWRMFINGTEEDNAIKQPEYINNNVKAKLAIGRKGASRGDWYKGKIDEVLIYNRVLTSEEISAISAKPCPGPDCSEKVTAGFNPAISESNVLSLSLKETSLKSLKTVHWSVNDSIHTEEHFPVFSGLTPGTYSVKAKTISINGCIDSVVQSVTIVKKEAPVQTTVTPGSVLPGYDTRKMEISKSFDIKGDSVRVFLSDNGIVDGDSITLVYDGKIILTHYLLKAKPLELILPVSKDKPVHELIMYAENLGSIPPNTSLMKVYDGSKKHEVYIRASENSNAVVKFRRIP
jgi:Concanavalin A-like lectin/glucanases superfamily